MKRALSLLCLAGLSLAASAGEPSNTDRGTVLGPDIPALTEGATHLRQGNAETGIRLTQRGLLQATDDKNKYIAYSNLCAGYILIEQMQKAISYCDRALLLNKRNHQALSNRALARFYLKEYELARDDVRAGKRLAPHSHSLRRVGQMIDDVLNPVTPEITIEHSQGDDAL